MISNTMNGFASRLTMIKNSDQQPLTENAINAIKEIAPNHTLPNDFIDLNKICRCDYFNLFEFYNFGVKEGVVEETLYYRKKYKLKNNYIVLFSDDVSFVILNVISINKSEVIWCDEQDFFNLCDGKSMEYNPTIFSSFTDFFEYLLDEEEKMQAEDKL